MAKIGLGIIGCGGISNVHLTALSKRDDVEIACLCDIDEQRAQEQKEKYRGKTHTTNMEELVARKDVQAVVVCVPTWLHPEAVIGAARAGKQVLCEKPIALRLDLAEDMIRACDEAGVIFMMAFVRRFCNEWLKLRELLQGGLMGHPAVWRQASASSGPAMPWFNDKDKGGGPFVDGCVHDFDFARFTFGEAKRVVASTYRFKSTAIDTGTAIIQFESGDEIVRSWSWGLAGVASGAHGDSLHDVIGPMGGLLFPGAADSETGMASFTFIGEDGKEQPQPFKFTGGQEWFDEQMDHFIECVREEKTPKVTGIDGKRATQISLAVLEAGASGQPLDLVPA